LKPKTASIKQRFYNVKLIKGKIAYKDNLILNEKINFDSFDLIVNNTNYQPEYLRKIYVVEFYQILKKLEIKLKKQNKDG
jgi:hypothetical protein